MLKLLASAPDQNLLENDSSTVTEKKPRSRLALIGLAVTGRICLPFVPATENQINNVLKLCRKCGGERSTLVDLGSGDGRIVFSAAKNGYQATGYELNPWLVIYSKISARLQNLSANAVFERRDLWKVDYKNYDNIVIFGVADMMDELSVKLEEDMKENSRVIACRFEIPRWTPVEEIQDGVDSAWLYTKESFQR